MAKVARNISYHDHNGNYMSREQWEEKQADEEYRLVKKFDNGEVRAFVYWDGEIKDAADSYRAYYRWVGEGSFQLDYTVRLNNAGRFELPPTRVEALYAPEVFGETPAQAIQVLP